MRRVAVDPLASGHPAYILCARNKMSGGSSAPPASRAADQAGDHGAGTDNDGRDHVSETNLKKEKLKVVEKKAKKSSCSSHKSKKEKKDTVEKVDGRTLVEGVRDKKKKKKRRSVSSISKNNSLCASSISGSFSSTRGAAAACLGSTKNSAGDEDQKLHDHDSLSSADPRTQEKKADSIKFAAAVADDLRDERSSSSSAAALGTTVEDECAAHPRAKPYQPPAWNTCAKSRCSTPAAGDEEESSLAPLRSHRNFAPEEIIGSNICGAAFADFSPSALEAGGPAAYFPPPPLNHLNPNARPFVPVAQVQMATEANALRAAVLQRLQETAGTMNYKALQHEPELDAAVLQGTASSCSSSKDHARLGSCPAGKKNAATLPTTSTFAPAVENCCSSAAIGPLSVTQLATEIMLGAAGEAAGKRAEVEVDGAKRMNAAAAPYIPLSQTPHDRQPQYEHDEPSVSVSLSQPGTPELELPLPREHEDEDDVRRSTGAPPAARRGGSSGGAFRAVDVRSRAEGEDEDSVRAGEQDGSEVQEQQNQTGDWGWGAGSWWWSEEATPAAQKHDRDGAEDRSDAMWPHHRPAPQAAVPPPVPCSPCQDNGQAETRVDEEQRLRQEQPQQQDYYSRSCQKNYTSENDNYNWRACAPGGQNTTESKQWKQLHVDEQKTNANATDGKNRSWWQWDDGDFNYKDSKWREDSTHDQSAENWKRRERRDDNESEYKESASTSGQMKKIFQEGMWEKDDRNGEWKWVEKRNGDPHENNFRDSYWGRENSSSSSSSRPVEAASKRGQPKTHSSPSARPRPALAASTGMWRWDDGKNMWVWVEEELKKNWEQASSPAGASSASSYNDAAGNWKTGAGFSASASSLREPGGDWKNNYAPRASASSSRDINGGHWHGAAASPASASASSSRDGTTTNWNNYSAASSASASGSRRDHGHTSDHNWDYITSAPSRQPASGNANTSAISSGSNSCESANSNSTSAAGLQVQDDDDAWIWDEGTTGQNRNSASSKKKKKKGERVLTENELLWWCSRGTSQSDLWRVIEHEQGLSYSQRLEIVRKYDELHPRERTQPKRQAASAALVKNLKWG